VGGGGVSLTVAEYAAAKQLPEGYLRDLGVRDADWYGTPAIAVPYRDQDGADIAVRYRLSLNGPNPFRWPEGTRAKGLVYGLDGWDLAASAGYALLVEGESCCQTGRLHGTPVFGIPGALMFDDERTSPCLEGIETLYAVQEPGEAGERFIAALHDSSLADRVRVVRFEGVKDLSEVHLAVSGKTETFHAALKQAIGRAEPLAESADDNGVASHEPIEFVTAEEFAAVDEPGAEPLLGTPGSVLLPANGDAMWYGGGGSGKTSLELDGSFHLATGLSWLGIAVLRPVRVALIENEGPRPLFRRKIAARLASWSGPLLEGRVRVYKSPWYQFRFDEAAEMAQP
jgi:hypothetical protein